MVSNLQRCEKTRRTNKVKQWNGKYKNLSLPNGVSGLLGGAEELLIHFFPCSAHRIRTPDRKEGRDVTAHS
jgi:hypothetical protein